MSLNAPRPLRSLFIDPPIDRDLYPESDGQPLAENTTQYEWIATIKGNLDVLFRDDPDVFVAGDLLWYPVAGHPEIARAPDILVVFGRPRSSGPWGSIPMPEQATETVESPGPRAVVIGLGERECDPADPRDEVRAATDVERHGSGRDRA